MTAGEVRLMGSMLGWRIALPALKRLLPLPRLVRLMARDGRRAGTGTARVEPITTAARRLFRPRIPGADNCLERSLLVYRYLLRDGARPELICGVERNGGGIAGHAWVQLDGHPVSDSPEAVARFAPIVRFGPDGER